MSSFGRRGHGLRPFFLAQNSLTNQCLSSNVPLTTMKLEKFSWFFVLAVQSLWLSGCATHALWEDGRFARYHEPANPANLRLFHSKERREVLVEYDEGREDSDSIRRRAFWLEPNLPRLEERRKPRFV